MIKSVTIGGVDPVILSSGLHAFFWLFLLCYASVGSLLVYYWNKSEIKTRLLFASETVFILGSILLAIIAFIALQNI